MRTFQHPQLAASLTIAENVRLGASLGRRVHGGSGADETVRVGEALELFGCAAYAEGLPDEVPYGVRKMAEVARAAAVEPIVLLLDEPAAGLSREERAELIAAIEAYYREHPQTALCLVEHDVPLVTALCPELLVLAAGQRLASGPAEEGRPRRAGARRVPRRERRDQGQGGSGLMLRAVNLHAGYRRGVPVLHGIELEVGAGGALGVIGRNGAGKTCLAQTLTGALPVMDGQVLLGGDDVSAKESRARVRARLSHVPEGRMIFADLTVRENLEVAAYGAGVKLTAQQLRDVEQRFPILERKAHDRAGSLSGGEQQWLAIGRALVQQPRVIVLDEPSLGLSPVAIDGVAEALVGIREAGVALILMEQNPYLLKAVCDEVLLLDQGRVTSSLDGEAGEQLVAEAYFGG